MKKLGIILFVIAASTASTAWAQTAATLETSAVIAKTDGGSDDDKKKAKDKKTEPAAQPTAAADDGDKTGAGSPPPPIDPLIRLLVSKGVLSEADASAVSGGSAMDQRDKLAALLLQKGLISNTEFETIRVAPTNTVATSNAVYSPSGMASALPQETRKPEATATQPNDQPRQAAAAAVVAAVVPIRVMQLEGTKRDGLIPDIKLGSGAKLKLYGFFKTSVVHDTSRPDGNDFPLPGFLNDSGPNGSPEFHLKARGLRLGANFEWLDPIPKVTLTGRAELDFEGDFPRANSRNIASIRANQPNLRLAWMRADYLENDRLSYHVLFGQDWTPFASSTNPQTIETTGFHLAFGNIYQRLPQIRAGLNYQLSKNRNVRFQPEIAMVLPLYGNLPSNISDQLGFGERQGVDSQRPELQGRFVLQFQLDKSPGVAPAQLIASWMQGERKAIFTRDNISAAINANAALTVAQRAAIISQFSTGAEVETSRYGYTAEFQLPTRFVTIVSKFYSGQDLRGYFGGQLFSVYNDTFGLSSTTNIPSIDGSATGTIGFSGGAARIADQRPIHAQGGFINVGFPLGRIFGVDPKSRLAGLQSYLHYGVDEARPRDVRRLLGTTLNPVGQTASSFGANRTRGDVFMGSLQYKVNSFVTFAYEQSLFRTFAANQVGLLPLFRGIPTSQTHNIRSEFATIFTF